MSLQRLALAAAAVTPDGNPLAVPLTQGQVTPEEAELAGVGNKALPPDLGPAQFGPLSPAKTRPRPALHFSPG